MNPSMRCCLCRMVLALALGGCALPSLAQVLFSDLGPLNSYQVTTGWIASGSASTFGAKITAADQFTVTGSGNYAVNGIDLGISSLSGSNTFTASIWTDVSGLPGAQLGSWNLSTSTTPWTCCALVSLSGITGVTLTGGASYFMVIGPQSLSDSSFNAWYFNNQSVFSKYGNVLYSRNGGAWQSDTAGPIGAFRVLGTVAAVPEPSALAGLLAGLALMAVVVHRRRKSPVRPCTPYWKPTG